MRRSFPLLLIVILNLKTSGDKIESFEERKVDFFLFISNLSSGHTFQRVLFVPVAHTLVVSPCSWRVQTNVIHNRIPSEYVSTDHYEITSCVSRYNNRSRLSESRERLCWIPI